MSMPNFSFQTADPDIAGIQIALQGLKQHQNFIFNKVGDTIFYGEWIKENQIEANTQIKITMHCAQLLAETMWSNQFGVNMEQLIMSFEGTELKRSGADKSGGFFAISNDRAYMVKGIFNENITAAKDIFPSFIQYLEDEPCSTLARIVAVFSVRIGLKTRHYCIMKNIFTSPLEIAGDKIFDIKGRLDRQSEQDGQIKKEMEFLSQYDAESATKLKFRVGQQITRDVQYLKSRNLFDYSILLGFYENKVEVGIIDILTPFAFWRRPAGTIKKLMGRSSSGCPPLEYAERVCYFMKQFGFETGWKQLKKKWSTVGRILSIPRTKSIDQIEDS